ncbi:dehydrogenase/reductase SDR family member on chromosome X-like isoform X2 [Anneissia japonica]|nr:dehydrogenase/reductase SDR family member on chromosome X-like isoform X2 [Anneissia japonica]XP_033095911.1 dehydrogenase/reductase SDR family member on chromosome X-like isoform X2 [Anneissia japonica]XP_033095912.1 dehydrogenase/reductase SDR family member on chromosome X-like isoform X2 [Anneissia japonica]XP_033095914.1 dehydrogenase/reductase SDR family member on chromosome X-like isoform X2 [Anneissia japonica]XP_033095915.1 dehydrogenase/reductase SDR family member on chromosome X-li
MIPPFSETEDGFELQFQVNYLGHFLLSLLLLDLLVDSGEVSKFSRIVNISSVVHVCGDLQADNLINRQVYCAYSSYAVSKLAIILSTYKLHQKLVARGSHVTVNCVHPGVVNTLLYQHSHWALQPFRKLLAMLRFLKTPTQGSDTPVYVALSTEIEGVGGLYFDNCVAKRSSTKSHDECLQCTLWDCSLELASIKEKF